MPCHTSPEALNSLCTQPVRAGPGQHAALRYALRLLALAFVHTSSMLQTVQMSKRALLAALTSLAILPLQATQALALGDSKTVSVTTDMSNWLSTFLYPPAFCFASSISQQICNHSLSTVMQVFVAGATGNTGKRVVQQLSAKGIKVLAGTRVCCTPAVVIITRVPLVQMSIAHAIGQEPSGPTQSPDYLSKTRPGAGS